MKQTPFLVRFPSHLKVEFQAACERRGVAMGAKVRELIRLFLDQDACSVKQRRQSAASTGRN